MLIKKSIAGLLAGIFCLFMLPASPISAEEAYTSDNPIVDTPEYAENFEMLMKMTDEERIAYVAQNDPEENIENFCLLYREAVDSYPYYADLYESLDYSPTFSFRFLMRDGWQYDVDDSPLPDILKIPESLMLALSNARTVNWEGSPFAYYNITIWLNPYQGYSYCDEIASFVALLCAHPDVFNVYAEYPLRGDTTTETTTTDTTTETTITPTFDDLLAMSKEEICALSDEMSAEYTEGKRSYDYVKYNQVIQFLTFYDDSYREKPYDLFRDAGLPDGLVCNVVRGGGSEEIVSVDEDGNIIDSNGSHSFEYDYSLYPEYDEETVFIAGYLTLITSPLISDVLHDHVAGWDTPATTPSTTETTTTDTTPESTTTLAPETTTASTTTTASATTAAATTAASTTTTAAASGAASSPKTGDASAAALCMGAAAALASMCLCRRKSR